MTTIEDYVIVGIFSIAYLSACKYFEDRAGEIYYRVVGGLEETIKDGK